LERKGEGNEDWEGLKMRGEEVIDEGKEKGMRG
jgi:hypothetical protein